MTGTLDRIEAARGRIVQALNLTPLVPPNADTKTLNVVDEAWFALGALVEVAKAAQERTHAGHGPNCDWTHSDERHQYPCTCGHIPLVDALARLEDNQ